MKKKKKIFLIIFLCLFLSLSLSIRADSGWDGSYDSGGSSWGGSSSGGSSWSGGSHSSEGSHNYGSSHDYSSGGSSYTINENTITIFIKILSTIFVIMILIITYKALTNILYKNKKIEKEQSNSLDDIFYKIGYDENNIKKILPDFDINEFRTETYEIYKKIQIAWMNFDYETLEKYTTNELYNLYKSELIALKSKKQQNIMENFELLDFSLFNMEQGANDISIKIRMKICCNDYVVDSKNKIVRGSKDKGVYDYEMTFTKGLSPKDNKCPNCNAPLENNVTSKCPYCDSIVISTNHNWVLSKKRVINQYRRR